MKTMFLNSNIPVLWRRYHVRILYSFGHVHGRETRSVEPYIFSHITSNFDHSKRNWSSENILGLFRSFIFDFNTYTIICDIKSPLFI